MIYLAHCSFEESGDTPTFGYFIYIVEADDYETAVEQLGRKLTTARETTDVFDRPVKIYLDDMLEITALPKRGVIARYQAHVGEDPGSLSSSLPADDPSGCRVIRPSDVADDDDEVEDDLEDDEGVQIEPFMTFGAKET
jgi:hypothetical protein